MSNLTSGGIRLPKRVLPNLAILEQALKDNLPVGPSLRPYWHQLFDICPSLLKLDAPEGRSLLYSYLYWAARRPALPNWQFYLDVSRWLLLSPYRHRVSDEQLDILLDASALRWSDLDQGPTQAILLYRRGGEQLSLARKRGSRGRQLESLDPSQVELPTADFAWALLDDGELPTHPNWQALPV